MSDDLDELRLDELRKIQRDIPEPLLQVLQQSIPRLMMVTLESPTTVYLIFGGRKKTRHPKRLYITKCVATDIFLEAIRVADTGAENLYFWLGEHGRKAEWFTGPSEERVMQRQGRA